MAVLNQEDLSPAVEEVTRLSIVKEHFRLQETDDKCKINLLTLSILLYFYLFDAYVIHSSVGLSYHVSLLRVKHFLA